MRGVGVCSDGPCRLLNRQYTGIFSLKYLRHFVSVVLQRGDALRLGTLITLVATLRK